MTISRREFLKSLTFFAGVAAVPIIAAASLLEQSSLTQEVDVSLPFGQKTLTSNVDKVGIRRLIVYIKKVMEDCLYHHHFEPNDMVTRNSVATMMTAFMQDLKSRRAMIDCKVICNEENNTPEHLDKNQIVLHVYVKHYRSVEITILKAVCSRAGYNI